MLSKYTKTNNQNQFIDSWQLIEIVIYWYQINIFTYLYIFPRDMSFNLGAKKEM